MNPSHFPFIRTAVSCIPVSRGATITCCAVAATIIGAASFSYSLFSTNQSQTNDNGPRNWPHSPAPPDSGTANSYSLEVAGAYVGQGSASLAGSTVQVNASIKDLQGNTGSFSVSFTIVDGHFRGSGTAMGSPITIIGRIDPSDDSSNKSAVLQASRLVGTYTTTSGLHGRIAGQWINPAPTAPIGGGGGGGGGGGPDPGPGPGRP